MADVVKVSSTVSSVIAGAGVDFQGTVNDDGSISFGISQLSDNTTWVLGEGLFFPGLPVGATINSATFSFSSPVALATPEGSDPQLTATESSTLTSVGFIEFCADGSRSSFGGSPPAGNSIPFVPCVTSFLLDPVFSGTASIQLTGWTFPTTPGTYENGLLLQESIDYSMTVDYAPAVPEPSFFGVTAIATVGLLGVLFRRRLGRRAH
jgi:hypothetical protein